MKTTLRYTISGTAPALSAGTNCGRNAKTKIVSLGFRVLTRIPDTITRHGEAFTVHTDSPIPNGTTSLDITARNALNNAVL